MCLWIRTNRLFLLQRVKIFRIKSMERGTINSGSLNSSGSSASHATLPALSAVNSFAQVILKLLNCLGWYRHDPRKSSRSFECCSCDTCLDVWMCWPYERFPPLHASGCTWKVVPFVEAVLHILTSGWKLTVQCMMEFSMISAPL